MNVQIQSIKFNADKKLIDFINQKVSKLDRFFDNIIGAEVFLRVEKTQDMENKLVEVRLSVPGNDLIAHRQCKTFEEAIDGCVDALKIQIKKHKERLRNV